MGEYKAARTCGRRKTTKAVLELKLERVSYLQIGQRSHLPAYPLGVARLFAIGLAFPPGCAATELIVTAEHDRRHRSNGVVQLTGRLSVSELVVEADEALQLEGTTKH
jgi:hypothetical protein